MIIVCKCDQFGRFHIDISWYGKKVNIICDDYLPFPPSHFFFCKYCHHQYIHLYLLHSVKIISFYVGSSKFPLAINTMDTYSLFPNWQWSRDPSLATLIGCKKNALCDLSATNHCRPSLIIHYILMTKSFVFRPLFLSLNLPTTSKDSLVIYSNSTTLLNVDLLPFFS